MDSLIADFENAKISALTKLKSVNKYAHNVTIGPNSTSVGQNKCEVKVKENCKQQSSKLKNTPKINNKRTSLGKILTEIEADVKEEIESSIKSRIETFQNASKKLDNQLKSEWIKRQQLLIEQSQKQEELMMKVLEEHDKKSYDQIQQLQLQYQKQAEERNKKNLELQIKEKQRQHLLNLIESIQKQQHAFRLVYQDIATLFKEYSNTNIKNNGQKTSTISMMSTLLKSLFDNMDKVKEKCKAGSVSNSDFEIAISLVKEATKIKETLETLLKSLKEEQSRQVANEQEKKSDIPTASDTLDSARQIDNTNLQPTSSTIVSDSIQTKSVISETTATNNEKPSVPATISVVESFVSKNSLKMYANLQQFLETYKNSFAELANDPRLKQFRFHCQKAVNIPLNAISAVNSQHLLDKYQKLSNLLRGNPVEAGGTNVISSQHPQGIAFCTDLLAKKFVLQGDLLISSNPDSAHCYAAVMIALWHDFPDFGRLVLAYFYQTAPYLVPFYPPKISSQTDKDYYTSLGYNYIDDVVEKQDKFLKRMSGIMRLYSAVTISKLKRGQQGPHPHGLACAWRWISNVLNLDPRSDITATILFEFLEVTGSSMLAAYSPQFQKILAYINNVYLPKIQKIDSGGPATRLEVFLQKVKKHGSIELPKGRLPEGFW